IGNSRTFTFSPAPKILKSLSVFVLSPGTLTLTDNVGQRKSQSLVVGPMQLISTGWTRGSSTIVVSFTKGWNLGIDDIMYSDGGTSALLTIAPATEFNPVISGIAAPRPELVRQASGPSTTTLFVPSVVEEASVRTNLGINNRSGSAANL